jgi:hypothetical protein
LLIIALKTKFDITHLSTGKVEERVNRKTKEGKEIHRDSSMNSEKYRPKNGKET